MATGYRADLAHVHDVGFTDFARGSAPWLLALLKRSGVRQELVVDLGCGSGVWAARLLAAGYEVLGIDQSPEMIRLARRRAPGATFRVGSFVTAALPPCGAVTAIGEVLGYAFDPRSDARALARLFARVFTALRPGGLFVFDLAGPGRAGKVRRSFTLGEDWAVLVDRSEDARRRVLERRITTFRRIGRAYRRDEELHRVRLYAPVEVRRALVRAGFRVRGVNAFGAVRFAKGLAGFVAVKPRR